MNVSGSDWGWGGNGYWGAAAIGAATGAAIGAAASPDYGYGYGYGAGPGTVVYSLPPSCTPVIVNGTTYQSCNGVYYAPTYDGATVAYQTVPMPQ